MLHLASLMAVRRGYPFPRIWYFALLVPVLALGLAIGLATVPSAGTWYRLALIAAVVIVGPRSATIERMRSGDYAPQARFLQAVGKVDALPRIAPSRHSIAVSSDTTRDALST
ncbi:MAG: hypothetical protein WKH64_05425 [Chloroflexia bacterium]